MITAEVAKTRTEWALKEVEERKEEIHQITINNIERIILKEANNGHYCTSIEADSLGPYPDRVVKELIDSGFRLSNNHSNITYPLVTIFWA